MSSQLTSLVPVLAGPNYQQWAGQCAQILDVTRTVEDDQKKGTYHDGMTKIAAVPATDDAEEIPAQEGGEDIDEDALEAWEENNCQSPRQHLPEASPDIQAKHKSEDGRCRLLPGNREGVWKARHHGDLSGVQKCDGRTGSLEMQDPMPGDRQNHWPTLADLLKQRNAAVPDFIKAMMMLCRMLPCLQ